MTKEFFKHYLEGTVMGLVQDDTLSVTCSIRSHKDWFSRPKGREICRKRMAVKPEIVLPIAGQNPLHLFRLIAPGILIKYAKVPSALPHIPK